MLLARLPKIFIRFKDNWLPLVFTDYHVFEQIYDFFNIIFQQNVDTTI